MNEQLNLTSSLFLEKNDKKKYIKVAGKKFNDQEFLVDVKAQTNSPI